MDLPAPSGPTNAMSRSEALAPPRFEADAVDRTDRTGSVEGVGKSLDNALKMDRWG